MTLSPGRTCCQALRWLAGVCSEAVHWHYTDMPGLRFAATLSAYKHTLQQASKHSGPHMLPLPVAEAEERGSHNPQTQLLDACTFGCLALHRYKDFLDSVTPAEWFVAQAEKQEVSKTLFHSEGSRDSKSASNLPGVGPTQALGIVCEVCVGKGFCEVTGLLSLLSAAHY